MKKIFTFSLLLCLCTAAFTQNSSPYWSITGNNNETGTSKLGTTNNTSLHFYTNNSQRMYIDSSNGRVGIGTTAPQDRLHVNSSGSENAFRAQVGGSTKLLVYSNGGTALGSNVTPPTNGLYVNGNTGLGNTTPVYKLEVKGDIALDSGVFRITGDPVLKYNSANQSIAIGNAGGTGTRLNTAVGYQALTSNTTGQDNTAIGHKALYNDNTGYSNVAVGSHALYSSTSGIQSIGVGDSALFNNTASYNVAIGSKALYSNTTGSNNVANGYRALYLNTAGTSNTAVGNAALYNNGTGAANPDDASRNTAVGDHSMYSNTTGLYNSALGTDALYSNTTGYFNTAIGLDALQDNSTGFNNTAIGLASLNVNATGNANTATGSRALQANTTGNNNVANGFSALYNNTIGNYNTANGWNALYLNTTGSSNIAIGVSALYNNRDRSNSVAIGNYALYNNGLNESSEDDGSYNTAIGSKALYYNTGGYNTANGYMALYSNKAGYNNSANGYEALYSNTSGQLNTATGSSALYSNTAGEYNTANGYYALHSNTTGDFNTAIGPDADVNNGSYNNSSAFGCFATITASNQVRIGSVGDGPDDPTSIGGVVGWSTLSDGRVKKNINENVPGLVFINKLKPITYTIDNDAINKIVQRPALKDKDGKLMQHSATEPAAGKVGQQIVHTGFVAQDVEKVAKDMNYEFSGVDAAKNDKDLYGLRYAEFVVPLVKAVQELSKQNDSLHNTIADMKNDIAQLKAAILSGSNATGSTITTATKSVTLSSAVILQNVPNPFTNSTAIQYSLPSGYNNAMIVITDKAGKTLKTVALNGSYSGNLQVEASTLAAGAYQYALIVDGKLVDTKQMIRTK